jgi:hypothetical protein
VIPDRFRWFKDMPCSAVRCEQAPVVVSWESVGTHARGVGDVGLEITEDGLFSEPRLCADRIVLTLDRPIDPLTAIPANVACTGLDVGGDPVACSPFTVATATGDTQVVITFNPPLTDFARYRVTVNGLTGVTGLAAVPDPDARCFTMLLGDVSGDRRVRANDVGGARGFVGTDPIDPLDVFQVRSDVSCDGRIRSNDVGGVRSMVGNDARSISCPP